jgi:hypothetical protein
MTSPLVIRTAVTAGVMFVSWVAAKALHLAPPKPRVAWAGIQTVRQATAEDALLTQALADVIDAGAGPIFGAETLGIFMRHVHHELSQHRASKLCLPMIVEGVVAANVALWTTREAGRFLIALQRELDANGGSAFPYLQRVIALVREGESASEVLTSDGALAVSRTPAF